MPCFSALPQRIRAGCDSAAVGAALFTSFFATAHSRGLRRCWKPSLTATRFFATAHSRGLRRSKTKSSTTLCCFATAHSRGLRPSWRNNPIPSRLLCHSAFARVATVVYCVCCRYCAIFATAHSRGLRLSFFLLLVQYLLFATAHSRGLRLVLLPTRGGILIFATAHSRGLRPTLKAIFWYCSALPQRIRAGCDGRVPAVVSTQYAFATAHSRGLRLRKSNAAHCEFAARR